MLSQAVQPQDAPARKRWLLGRPGAEARLFQPQDALAWKRWLLKMPDAKLNQTCTPSKSDRRQGWQL